VFSLDYHVDGPIRTVSIKISMKYFFVELLVIKKKVFFYS